MLAVLHFYKAAQMQMRTDVFGCRAQTCQRWSVTGLGFGNAAVEAHEADVPDFRQNDQMGSFAAVNISNGFCPQWLFCPPGQRIFAWMQLSSFDFFLACRATSCSYRLEAFLSGQHAACDG
jgi:hypothetical protein